MSTEDVTIALSALATVMFLVWCVLTVIARRLDRRQMADQAEVERRWPMLAIEDFTEEDELAPQVEAAPTLREERILVRSAAHRPHSECVDSWADGRAPCGRCQRILGVRTP